MKLKQIIFDSLTKKEKSALEKKLRKGDYINYCKLLNIYEVEIGALSLKNNKIKEVILFKNRVPSNFIFAMQKKIQDINPGLNIQLCLSHLQGDYFQYRYSDTKWVAPGFFVNKDGKVEYKK